MAPTYTFFIRISVAYLLTFSLVAVSASGQDGSRGSRNMKLVSHIPLGGMKAANGSATAGFEALGRNTGDVVLDQGRNRPFVFVARKGDVPGVVAMLQIQQLQSH